MAFLFDKDLEAWKSYDRVTKRVILSFIAAGCVATMCLLGMAVVH